MRHWNLSYRLLAGFLCVAINTLSSGFGCRPSAPPPLAPRPGLPLYQEPLALPIGAVTVNLAGGNLMVRRLDLSLDTRVVRPFELAATWNSATGAWTRSFDMLYDGARFVDATGAEYDVSGVAYGERIPGSAWIKLDAIHLKTLGGLVHRFDPDTHLLRFIHWSTADFPRIKIRREAEAPYRAEEIVQCRIQGECGELVASFSRDADGRYAAIVDRAGRVATFAYDAEGLLTGARDALDVEKNWSGFHYSYDSQGRVSEIENSEGERVALGWQGRAIHEIRMLGAGDPAYRFERGKSGGLYWTRVENPKGDESVLRTDGEGRVREVEDAHGEHASVAWEGYEIASRSDRAGVETTWSYPDADTRVEVRPGGNVVVTRFASASSPLADRDRVYARPVLRIDDSLGPVETRSYDAAGRLVAVADGDGQSVSYTYDAEENPASVVLPSGETAVEYSDYGEHGRPASLYYPGSLFSEYREYDAVGNQLTGWNIEGASDPGRGGILRRGYDADRNLARLELLPTQGTQPQTGPPELLLVEHRSDGKVTRVQRPYGGDSELVYDAVGRPIESRERVDGAWRTTRFEYDAASNAVAVELPNGMRREAAFGAAGELEELRFLRDGVPEQVASFGYAHGRLVSVHDSSYGAASEVLVYDGAGRVAEHHFPRGEVLLRSFDARGRVAQERFELDGEPLRTLAYAYDGADHRVEVRDQGEAILEKEFQGRLLTRIRYGNGLERSFEYQGLVLRGSTTTGAAGELVETSDVAVEACGGVAFFCSTAATTTIGSAAATSVERAVLAPTPQALALAGPRVVAWGSDPDGAPELDGMLYDYDALGNLSRHAAGGPSDFVFNAERNRLLAGAGHSYAYDAAGFASERDGVPLRWTASGRIASIGSQAVFAWDAQGRPVLTSVAGLGTAIHLFGGLVQADLQGRPHSLAVGNEVQIRLDQAGRVYRHFDYRGNVKFVTDDTGDVIAHYRYSAYAPEEPVGGEAESRSFAQGRALGDTELLWLGERIYDPEVGRFLSPEPGPQLVNQYSYTLGNPVWTWDPSGRAAEIASPGDAASAPTTTQQILQATVVIGVGIGLVLGGLVLLAIALSALGWISNGHLPWSIPTPSPTSPDPGPPGGPTGGGSGGGGGGGGGGSGTGNGGGPSCSPTQVGALPDLGWLLALLAPLTAALGLAVLAARRREADGAALLDHLRGRAGRTALVALLSAAGCALLGLCLALAGGAIPWPF